MDSSRPKEECIIGARGHEFAWIGVFAKIQRDHRTHA